VGGGDNENQKKDIGKLRKQITTGEIDEVDQFITPASDISQESVQLSDCNIDELESNDSPEIVIAASDISQGSGELSDCNNDDLEYNDSCETPVKILPPWARVLVILGMLCSYALSVYIYLIIFGVTPFPWHR